MVMLFMIVMLCMPRLDCVRHERQQAAASCSIGYMHVCPACDRCKGLCPGGVCHLHQVHVTFQWSKELQAFPRVVGFSTRTAAGVCFMLLNVFSSCSGPWLIACCTRQFACTLMHFGLIAAHSAFCMARRRVIWHSWPWESCMEGVGVWASACCRLYLLGDAHGAVTGMVDPGVSQHGMAMCLMALICLHAALHASWRPHGLRVALCIASTQGRAALVGSWHTGLAGTCVVLMCIGAFAVQQ